MLGPGQISLHCVCPTEFKCFVMRQIHKSQHLIVHFEVNNKHFSCTCIICLVETSGVEVRKHISTSAQKSQTDKIDITLLYKPTQTEFGCGSKGQFILV